jgi:hypothetical protein
MSNDDNEDVLGIDLLSDMTELPESEFHILEEDLKLKVAKDVDYIKDTAKFIKLEPFEQLELTRIYKRSIIAKEMLNSGERFNKKIKTIFLKTDFACRKGNYSSGRM